MQGLNRSLLSQYKLHYAEHRLQRFGDIDGEFMFTTCHSPTQPIIDFSTQVLIFALQDEGHTFDEAWGKVSLQPSR